MSKRIFLTGGTGFFGKSILSCRKRGMLPPGEWTILSRSPERFLANNPEFAGLPGICWVAGDVRDFPFPETQFDWIIHAATPAVTTLPPGEMRSIVVEGTRRVLEFARRCGAEKLLLTSSGAVYGVQVPELEKIPEEFPCNPVTEYGVAKLEAEKLCLDSGLSVVLARCFAFTGRYLNREIHFAIGNFIRDALAGREIVIKGDGTPLRSYLYADDLVKWLFRLLEKGEAGRAYNVGSDVAVSIHELAQLVKRVLNSNSEIVVRERATPGRLPSRYVPSIERAGRELGLTVEVPLEEAICRSVRKDA